MLIQLNGNINHILTTSLVLHKDLLKFTACCFEKNILLILLKDKYIGMTRLKVASLTPSP